MFDKDRFLEDCRAALREREPQAAVRELVTRAVRERAPVLRALGEPVRGGVETLYRSPELTVLNLCWAPRMILKPHDHRIWAIIGIYEGREQNVFFTRSASGLTQRGSKTLNATDVAVLGDTAIHAVTNPLDRITGAIHVYGGDFFAVPRSEWNPETLEEQPYDVEDTLRAFERANATLRENA